MLLKKEITDVDFVGREINYSPYPPAHSRATISQITIETLGLDLQYIDVPLYIDTDPLFLDKLHGHKHPFALRLWEYMTQSHQRPPLLLAHISAEVGMGVFALDTISPGTIIGIYTGELKTKQQLTTKSDYFMESMHNPEQIIDAKAVGSITRFIQHMPYSHEHLIREILEADQTLLLQLLKANVMDAPTYFNDLLCEIDDTLIQSIVIEGLPPLYEYIELVKKAAPMIEALYQHHSLPTKELNLIKDIFCKKLRYEALAPLDPDDWETEWRVKPFLNDIGGIATANIGLEQIDIDGLPIIFLYAAREIKPHQQLGFSYSLSYWNLKRCVPEYFFENGDVIPRDVYLPTLLSIQHKYQYPSREEGMVIPSVHETFHCAVTAGCVEDVAMLLAHGIDPNCPFTFFEMALDRVPKESSLYFLLKSYNAATYAELHRSPRCGNGFFEKKKALTEGAVPVERCAATYGNLT